MEPFKVDATNNGGWNAFVLAIIFGIVGILSFVQNRASASQFLPDRDLEIPSTVIGEHLCKYWVKHKAK